MKSILSLVSTLDQLKTVLRKTSIMSGERRENSAEHSWHICMIAILLQNHSNENIDITKVLKMLLLHDLPEIIMGDTVLYDEKTRTAHASTEKDHLLSLLSDAPENIRNDLVNVFVEFQTGKTPEARYANAIDRLQPILCNFIHKGGTWKSLNISKEKVLEKNKVIAKGSINLWILTQELITEANAKGYFPRS